MVPPPVVVPSSLLVTELVEENMPPAMIPPLRISPLNEPSSMVPKLSIFALNVPPEMMQDLFWPGSNRVLPFCI